MEILALAVAGLVAYPAGYAFAIAAWEIYALVERLFR